MRRASVEAGDIPSFPMPKSLTGAVSIIQRLKLMENERRSLDKDFVVLDQVVGFSEVGIRSAWHDSLIWVVGYIFVGTIIYFLQENYLVETRTRILLWQLDGSPLYWISKAASFSGLIFSTGMCVYMSKFYVGIACKKAINSVLFTRALFLASFSLVIFVSLNTVSNVLLTGKVIEEFISSIAKISREAAMNLHWFLYKYLRRALFEAAIVGLLSAIASIITPFVSLIIFRVVRKRDRVLGTEGD